MERIGERVQPECSHCIHTLTNQLLSVVNYAVPLSVIAQHVEVINYPSPAGQRVS